ncbi:MAG: hypothetical protein R2876_01965 [Eubacteriales bacterium]
MNNTEEIIMQHSTEIAKHEEKIKTLTEQQKEIRELAKSTNNLAIAVEKLAEQFKNVDARLGVIENDRRYRINIVWSCIVTGMIGAAITFFMTSLLG